MHGMGQWVPMQDNDTAHHCVAAVAQSLNSKRHFDVQVVGNQPPDNPVIIHIENVWAWVTTQVDEKIWVVYENGIGSDQHCPTKYDQAVG